MPDSKDDNLSSVVVIHRDIGTLAKLDDPLAELGSHLLNRSSDLRMRGKQLHSGADRCDGAARCIGVLWRQKSMQPNHIVQCML